MILVSFTLYTDNNVKAMLSGDIDLYREAVERQNTPDCVFIQRFTNDTPKYPAYREIRGRDKIIEYVGSLMVTSPDMVVTISGRKLHVFEDGSSYLVSKGTYSGVTIFPIIFTSMMIKRAFKYQSHWSSS